MINKYIEKGYKRVKLDKVVLPSKEELLKRRMEEEFLTISKWVEIAERREKEEAKFKKIGKLNPETVKELISKMKELGLM